MKNAIDTIEDVIGFYHDGHECDEPSDEFTLPDGLGKGCGHLLEIETAWKAIKEALIEKKGECNYVSEDSNVCITHNKSH